MCGICGQLRFDGQPADADLVHRMREKLQHRGPDDEGLWFKNDEGSAVALGHKRLAILDLSDAGRQPMCDSSQNYWIVYNGEVYNYQEIRQSLVKSGFRFQTETDTEVVLAAYIKYGTECLDLFNGMFAFAIWDSRKNRLFCARDRLGIKPFYYTWRNNVFYFASEAKALLMSCESNPKPNPTSVFDYLSLGLMHHTEQSFFTGIRQIPAGCFLSIDASGLSNQCYWKLSKNESANEAILEPDALRNLIEDSVRLRLRSDVPVGILLSGGLDSSSITALAANHYDKRLQAFSLGFDDADFDETINAELTASHCGASLQILKPDGYGLWAELDHLISAQDAPTHAPEVYSNWCMMRAVAKNNAKVLLSGQGGDELFAGYNWYPKHFLLSLLRHMKIATFLREITKLPEYSLSNNTKNYAALLGSLLQGLLPSKVKHIIKPELKCAATILQPGYHSDMRDRSLTNLKMFDPPGLEEKMYNDLMHCSIPQYLHYEDANSMAFGIEERVPLLDHRLVEYAHQLSVWLKIHDGVSKYAFRLAMEGLLPPQIIKRRDKMGLSAPRDQWLRNDLHTQVETLFSEDCLIYDHWIDRNKFREQLKVYMRGETTPLERLLWRCINLEKWLRIYG